MSTIVATALTPHLHSSQISQDARNHSMVAGWLALMMPHGERIRARAVAREISGDLQDVSVLIDVDVPARHTTYRDRAAVDDAHAVAHAQTLRQRDDAHLVNGLRIEGI